MTDLKDRTIILERRIDAPRSLVWVAWTDPAAIPQWWGPEGHTCRTSSIDLREGGVWMFDMIGPDGTVYPNRHRYLEYVTEERIRYLLDDGVDSDKPPHADVTVVFEDLGDATRLRMEMVFATPENRDAVKQFGAVRLGYQTLSKLNDFLTM